MHCQPGEAAGMTKLDDRECIRGAAYDEAELRKQCVEGTARYLQALIAGGYHRRRGKPQRTNRLNLGGLTNDD